MKTRRVAVLAAVAALGLASAACGDGSSTTTSAGGTSASATASGSDAAEQPLNIWYVNVLPSYPAWGASMKLFESQATELNYKATAVGPPKVDATAMIELMEQAIADKADGIITCDIDPAAFKSTITKAQEAGIVVVTIGCVDDISDFSIGTDNRAFGEAAADLIAEKAGADAQVGIVSTDRTTPNQVAQVEAFEARIAAQHPNMKVVAWESGKGDTAVDAQKITSMIAANPGLKAVWCVEGTCPGGAQAGLQEAGKKPGDVFVLGIDNVETTMAALSAGWVSASLNQCFFDAPPLAVKLIRAKKSGNAPAQRSWAVATDVITKEKLPYQGCPSTAVPSL